MAIGPTHLRQSQLRPLALPDRAVRPVALGPLAVPPPVRMRRPGPAPASATTGADRAATIPETGLRTLPRLRPAMYLLLAIVAGTLVAFAYLTQTLAAERAVYRIDRLLVEREELDRQLATQQAEILRLGAEIQVVSWAQRQGLDPLGSRVRVEAR